MLIQRRVAHHFPPLRQTPRQAPAIPEHCVACIEERASKFECWLRSVGDAIADELQREIKHPLRIGLYLLSGNKHPWALQILPDWSAWSPPKRHDLPLGVLGLQYSQQGPRIE
ncbi:hypothetical protein UF16_17475 [Chromobacterium violaceum]|nr:hypothetical protein UF16_17475 [Chromobacterium violaceum]